MTGWIVGGRTVYHKRPLKREGKNALPPARRCVTILGPDALAQAVASAPVAHLPARPEGAGPCATFARFFTGFLLEPGVAEGEVSSPSAIEWSVRVLWPALAEHYAARGSRDSPQLGRYLGARTGPRGRQPAGAVL